MNVKGLVYSLDEDIKISDLKNNNFDISKYELEKIDNWLKDNKIYSMVEWDQNYNYKFLNIKSKPYIVYYKWNLDILNQKILWIVGPRKPTNYANKILEELFDNLKNRKLVTISWLADGIDSLCHELSIKNNIPTVAVLWWWLNHFLKSDKRHLIEKIIDNGWLVISEFKIKLKPANYTFPQRNRIIAWLCDVLFVPEAWLNSWSLITVDFAIEKNKKIYGVPNSIRINESLWINKYISDKKVESISDIKYFVDDNFEKKEITKKSILNNSIVNLSEEEKFIFEIIWKNDWIDIDNIISKTNKWLSEIMILLTNLEIKNLIYERLPWVYVVK